MKLFKIKKSKIDKNGLYANCNIKKGTKVIEYKGKVITRREAEINPKYDMALINHAIILEYKDGFSERISILNNLVKSERAYVLNGDEFDYAKYKDVFTYRGTKYNKSFIKVNLIFSQI